MKKFLLTLSAFLFTLAITAEASAPALKVKIMEVRLLPAPLELDEKDLIEKEIADFINIAPPEKCEIEVDLSILPQTQKEIFEKVVELYGCKKLKSLQTIEIFQNQDFPRALAGESILKIREDALYKSEYPRLITHELGHVVDLGYFKGTVNSGESNFKDGSIPIFNDDLSLKFYKISWQNEDSKKEDYKKEDFVSGYAMTNPFEDFAESVTIYVFKNNNFKIWANENEKLRLKFDFIKKHVFDGKEFDTGDRFASPEDISSRDWDATK